MIPKFHFVRLDAQQGVLVSQVDNQFPEIWLLLEDFTVEQQL